MGNVYVDTLFNVWTLPQSLTSYRLDSTTKEVATVFRALGKQITKIGVNVAAVSTPPVCLAQLESLTAGPPATPSGTIIAAGANGTFTPAAGINEITLGTPYTPALGDLLAAVVKYSSGTCDATHYTDCNYKSGGPNLFAPYALNYSGAAWAAQTQTFPALYVVYSDGSVHPVFSGLTAASTLDFNTGSSPDEYGIKFVCPGNVTIDGLLCQLRLRASATGALNLLDSGGSSLLGTDNMSLDATKDVPQNTSSLAIHCPITPVSLTSGSTYYLTLTPSTANNVSVTKCTFASAAARQAIFGDAWLVTRTNGGAWTEDTLSCVGFTPLLSAISTGGGASGGRRPVPRILGA